MGRLTQKHFLDAQPRIGREWIAADLLLGNLPETPATSMSSSLDLAGWDARIYSAHAK